MPTINPTRELVKREMLLLGPDAHFKERWSHVENFARAPVLGATFEPGTVNQATMRLLAKANQNFMISGTDAADAGSAPVVDGGCRVTTAGADNDQMIVSPLVVNNVALSALGVAAFEPQHETRIQWLVELPAITTCLIHVGLKLTDNLDLTTDDDQVFFQFSVEGGTSVANWTACTSTAGTDVESDCLIAAAAATTYNLEIRINSNKIARFYINGTKRYTSTALTAAAVLVPVAGVQALEAAAKSIDLRGCRISRVWQDAA